MLISNRLKITSASVDAIFALSVVLMCLTFTVSLYFCDESAHLEFRWPICPIFFTCSVSL